MSERRQRLADLPKTRDANGKHIKGTGGHPIPLPKGFRIVDGMFADPSVEPVVPQKRIKDIASSDRGQQRGARGYESFTSDYTISSRYRTDPLSPTNGYSVQVPETRPASLEVVDVSVPSTGLPFDHTVDEDHGLATNVLYFHEGLEIVAGQNDEVVFYTSSGTHRAFLPATWITIESISLNESTQKLTVVTANPHHMTVRMSVRLVDSGNPDHPLNGPVDFQVDKVVDQTTLLLSTVPVGDRTLRERIGEINPFPSTVIPIPVDFHPTNIYVAPSTTPSELAERVQHAFQSSGQAILIRPFLPSGYEISVGSASSHVPFIVRGEPKAFGQPFVARVEPARHTLPSLALALDDALNPPMLTEHNDTIGIAAGGISNTITLTHKEFTPEELCLALETGINSVMGWTGSWDRLRISYSHATGRFTFARIASSFSLLFFEHTGMAGVLGFSPFDRTSSTKHVSDAPVYFAHRDDFAPEYPTTRFTVALDQISERVTITSVSVRQRYTEWLVPFVGTVLHTDLMPKPFEILPNGPLAAILGLQPDLHSIYPTSPNPATIVQHRSFTMWSTAPMVSSRLVSPRFLLLTMGAVSKKGQALQGNLSQPYDVLLVPVVGQDGRETYVLKNLPKNTFLAGEATRNSVLKITITTPEGVLYNTRCLDNWITARFHV